MAYTERFDNAMRYIDKNLIEKAIIELRQCRNLTPYTANADYQLFQCYKMLGRNQEAETYRNRVLASGLAYLSR